MDFIKQKTLGLFVKTNGILSQPIFSGMGHILMFHSVVPKSSKKRLFQNSRWEVSPEYLEHVITYFRNKNYAIISLDALYETMHSSKKMKNKFIVLTFDDGYKNNLDHGFPILKKLNAPACIYVTTGFPEGKGIMWWHLLEDLILNRDKTEVIRDGKNYQYLCKTDKEKSATFDVLHSFIMNNNSDTNLTKTLEGIFTINGIDLLERTKQESLSWEEIRYLSSQELITIGAHTENHYVLSLLDEKKMYSEIHNSKTILEKEIKKSVDHFAYPFGGTSQIKYREYAVAKQIGFKTSVTTRPANIFNTHKDHLECLPRVYMGEDVSDEELKYIRTGIRQFSNYPFKKTITL